MLTHPAVTCSLLTTSATGLATLACVHTCSPLPASVSVTPHLTLYLSVQYSPV